MRKLREMAQGDLLTMAEELLRRQQGEGPLLETIQWSAPRPLSELGLSTRVQRVLEQGELSTLESLLVLWERDPQELLELRGFGPKSLEQVSEKLEQGGFLAAEPEAETPPAEEMEAVPAEEQVVATEAPPEETPKEAPTEEETQAEAPVLALEASAEPAVVEEPEAEEIEEVIVEEERKEKVSTRGMALADLVLSPTTIALLEAVGIDDVARLVRLMEEDPEALLTVPGFSSRYVEEVEIQLQVFGYWDPTKRGGRAVSAGARRRGRRGGR
jgi:DNA-directed RNA polymerase alpha subunit